MKVFLWFRLWLMSVLVLGLSLGWGLPLQAASTDMDDPLRLDDESGGISENEQPTHKEKSALAPWELKLGYSFLSPNDDLAEKKAMPGISAQAGYEWPMHRRHFSTTSHFDVTYNSNSDEATLAGGGTSDTTYKVVGLELSQSLNYDIPVTEKMTLQPFAEVGLGYGFADIDVDRSNNSQIDEDGNAPLWELGGGANLRLRNGLMPFVKVSYKYFKVDEVERSDADGERNIKLSDRDRYEFGGTHIVMGMGYAF